MVSGCGMGLLTLDPKKDVGEDSGIPFDPSGGPLLDDIARYQNDDGLLVSGMSHPDDVVSLLISTSDTSYEFIAVSDADGFFSTEIALTRGVDTEIVAMNNDGSSAVFTTQACVVWDAFEIDETQGDDWGDTCQEHPIVISDAFVEQSLEDVTGNVLVDGDEDWFRVVTVDTTTTEERLQYEDYHFSVAFLEGQESYEMRVFKGGCAATQEECSSQAYETYEQYAHDDEPDEQGNIPADSRACGGEPFNECMDFSETYTIVVRRTDGLTDCTPYRIRIQNGVE